MFLWDLISKEEVIKERISGNSLSVFLHIGCYGSGDSGQWNWVNGQPVKYSNWNQVAPLGTDGIGGITLTAVVDYPVIKPKEWVVLRREHSVDGYICEWE